MICFLNQTLSSALLMVVLIKIVVCCLDLTDQTLASPHHAPT